MLAPVVIGACAVWTGLLALGNVRNRVTEIGILRALGVSSRRILVLFLARAAIIGLLGAGLGFAVGWLGSWLGEERAIVGPPLGPLFDPLLFALALVLTPVFSMLVSWLPTLWAAQLDPADSLRS
jgi:ABC-type lipoprotein release transport system permease subunit